MTWKDAMIKILSESDEPLHYQEITRRIMEQELRKKVGATPSATVNAQVTSSIKHEGEQSPFVRVGKGLFTLRTKLQSSEQNDAAVEEEETLYQIITSFGMYWRREKVQWQRSPKLYGMERLGAEPIDFSIQIGVYLLYDGREVIYVGRSTDRPLGRRLYEHTVDRLSVRWDRFSWFGLLPVDNSGRLEELPKHCDPQQLIPMLEAVLIEALEPRQNRKRGDEFGAIEYLQKVDPEIEKRRLKALIDQI